MRKGHGKGRGWAFGFSRRVLALWTAVNEFGIGVDDSALIYEFKVEEGS